MNWRRLSKLAAVVIGTFAVIALAGFVLISWFVLTVNTYRLMAFITVMLAVTGAVLAGVIAMSCSKQDGENNGSEDQPAQSTSD